MVRLREYHRDDIQTTWEYVNDPEVRGFLVPGIPFPWKREEEDRWFEEQNSRGDTYNFAIAKLDDDSYLGGCGINSVDWKNSVATVGIFLGKDFWSQGYGTDAMKTLVGFAFGQMNLNKVKLHVFSFNGRAVRSYEKVGFKIEGTLREQIYRNGRYHDEIIMGILRREWNS